MNNKTVFQLDNSGLFVGTTVADESPLEPGVWLMPAKTVDVEPPTEWPDDKWPRWNGSSWVLVNKPVPAAPANDNDPVAKLAAFLNDNPDVANLLAAKKG
jgi:hypothetical protein